MNASVETTPSADAAPARTRKASVRTCVGCGEAGAPDDMVRVVLGPDGALAVDLSGGTFGRGAHVHASPGCLRKAAPRGLSKSFRAEVRVDAAELARSISVAAERRVAGLVASAVRSGNAAVGADAVSEAIATGEAEAVVVAGDAGSIASSGAIQHAVSEGRAIGWGTKATLGDLTGRAAVAVLAVTSRRLAGAIRRAAATSDAVRTLVTRESTEDG